MERHMEQYKTSNLCHWIMDSEHYCHKNFEPLLIHYTIQNIIPYQVEELIRKDQLCYPFFDVEWKESTWNPTLSNHTLMDYVLLTLDKYLHKHLGNVTVYHARNIRVIHGVKKYSIHITCEDSNGTRYLVKDLREIALAINKDLKCNEDMPSIFDINVYRAKNSTLRLPRCYKHGEGFDSVLYLMEGDISKFLVTRK